jgi:hypothetical protein
MVVQKLTFGWILAVIDYATNCTTNGYWFTDRPFCAFYGIIAPWIHSNSYRNVNIVVPQYVVDEHV